MRIVLFEPDIAENTGTILRFSACLGVSVDIIEPCGFPFSLRALRRSGLDYLEHVDVTRHNSWDDYCNARQMGTIGNGRLLAVTTKADTAYTDARFDKGDSLLFGRESAGLPDFVHKVADLRLGIPMRPGMRSLNVALSCAMVLGEAMRQTGLFPHIVGGSLPPHRSG